LPRFNMEQWLCCLGGYDAEMVPPTRYTLRHSTASIMKGLVL